MTHPDRELTFGSFLFPKASEGPDLLKQASLAEDLGFDLVVVPDHVDWGHYVDEWVLMAAVLGRTQSVEVFSCVTSLALREPPAVIAKAAASLDRIAPGRFHFGLGSGVAPGIASIGGPLWEPREAFERVREAIELTRVMWSGQERGTYTGRYYQLNDASLPPAAPRLGSTFGWGASVPGCVASSPGQPTVGSRVCSRSTPRSLESRSTSWTRR